MNNLKIIYIFVLFFVIGSCKNLETNLSIDERKIPDNFQTSSEDSTSIAQMNWREYFADSHLNRLIDTALANNYDLKIAAQKIEALHAGVAFAKGRQLPTVDGVAWTAQERSAEYSVDWAGNEGGTFLNGDPLKPAYNDYYLGIISSWEVDVWSKLKNKKRAALSRYLASMEWRNFVTSNLIANIAISYYDLLALDNELKIIEETLLKQQEALEVVVLQKKIGQTNELAIQQFKAQLLNTQSLKKEKILKVTSTENFINFLIGRYPQPIERNSEQIYKEIPNSVNFGIPSDLLANRSDIRQAELELKACKFDLLSAKAEFYPSFNINAGIGFKAFKPEFLFISPESIAYSAIGSLVAPLINRKAIKSEFKSAKAGQLAAMYNYQKSILNGYVEVVNELSKIKLLKEINLIKKQEKETLENAVDASIEFHKMAKANYLEVLLAQQNSFKTQLELVDIYRRQKMSLVNIYKALGGGW